MSKKKNTLKDLDEFLKQQAATLVTPEKLADKLETKPVSPAERVEDVSDITSSEGTDKPVTLASIVGELKSLASRNNVGLEHQLYDVILHAIESKKQFTPEDRMLVNTALYLKHGERWKDAIREYWKNHS